MTKNRPIGEREVRRRAFEEAAALLEADMDDVDLNCETELSEEDESRMREYIRIRIVAFLKSQIATQ